MTKKQLEDLFDALGDFGEWMDDQPLQLALFDAITVVRLAVFAEIGVVASGLPR